MFLARTDKIIRDGNQFSTLPFKKKKVRAALLLLLLNFGFCGGHPREARHLHELHIARR